MKTTTERMGMMAALVIAASMGPGCAALRQSTLEASDAATLARVNELAEGNAATVIMRNRTQHTAASLRLEPEGTTWVNPATGRVLAVPTHEIWGVHIVKARRSALSRIAVGTIIGSAFGAATGAMVGNTPVCMPGNGCQPITAPAAIGAAAFGTAGGIVSGLGSGPEHGYLIRIDVPEPEDTSPPVIATEQ